MSGIGKEFLFIGLAIFSICFAFSAARGPLFGFKVGVAISLVAILAIAAMTGGFILFLAPLVLLATAVPVVVGILLGGFFHKPSGQSSDENG